MKRQVLSVEIVKNANEGTLWDETCKGLGVRCHKTKKSWIFRKKGENNSITIGDVEVISLLDARKNVVKLSGEKMNYTFGDLCEEWLNSYAIFKRKGVKEDRRRIHSRLLPELGKKLLTEINQRQVFVQFNSWSIAGEIEANRCLSLGHSIYNKGIEWDLVDRKNPFKFIQKNPEQARKRVANNDEIKRLLTVLRSIPGVGSILMICLYCGLRKSEAAGLLWKDINLNEGFGIVRKTKNGKDHKFFFGDEVRSRLIDEKSNSSFVFPSRRGGHRKDFTKDWSKILERSGIKDLIIHDLRRTFATKLYETGVPIGKISKALNHSSESVTRRYLHLDDISNKEVFDQADVIFSGYKTNKVSLLQVNI